MLSIVLPIYNEKENIKPLLDDFLEFFEKRGIAFEILAVNDGSTDGTCEVLKKYASNKNISVIEHSHNLGYGAALRSGFKKARGDLIFFTDSDRQFDIKEISTFLEKIKDYDFVAGFRKKRRDPWFRLFYAWLFSVASRILFGIKVKDIDCAFKLFKSNVIKGMPLSSDGALINLEIFSHAKKSGYKFLQLPVSHLPREKGKQTGGSLRVIGRAVINIFSLWKKVYKQEIYDFFSLLGIAGFFIFLSYFISFFSVGVLHDSLPFLRDIWLRWDARHYIDVAENWYNNPLNSTGESYFNIVFFPLYPIAIRITSTVFKNYFWSAIFVSNLCYIVSIVYLFKLVLIDFSKKTAFWAVLLFSLFPTAYFLHLPYSEGIFLALLLASFYYARKERWSTACILAAFTTATRLVGIVVIPALLLEYMHQKKFCLGNIKKDILWFLTIPLGFFYYLHLNVFIYGSPFAFLSLTSEHWFKRFSWPWIGIWHTARAFLGQSGWQKLIVSGAELFFIFLVLLILIVGIRKLRPSYSVFGFLTLFLITSTSYLMSLPRYTLSIFPIFIVLAFLTEKKQLLSTLLLVFSTSFYMLFLILYSLGNWTF